MDGMGAELRGGCYVPGACLVFSAPGSLQPVQRVISVGPDLGLAVQHPHSWHRAGCPKLICAFRPAWGISMVGNLV